MTIQKYGQYWAVYDVDGLVCLCVYKKGATEVARRLNLKGDASYVERTEEK